MIAFVGLLLWRALEEVAYKSRRVRRRASAWYSSATQDAQHRQRDEILDTGLAYILRRLARAQ